MRWVQSALLLLAFLLVEILLGGTRPVFSLPAYGVLAVAGLLGVFGPWKGLPALRVDCLAATLLFVAWVLLRAAFSPVPYLARPDVNLALGALVVYLLTATRAVTPRARLVVVLGLLAVGVLQSSLGGWQQFSGERLALFGLLEPQDYGRRASGLYICPNHLAGFLEMIVPLGLGVACWSRRSLALRAVALAGAAAGLFGLALTGSRGGYVSAACGLAVFAAGSLWMLCWAGRRQALTGLTVAGVMLLPLLAGLGAIYSRQQGVQVRVARLQSTEDGRFQLWQGAWAQAQLQPLIGTGSGTHHYYARLFRPSTVQADPVHAHNDYLELLAEYGWLGVVAGLGLLLTHLGNGFRTLRIGKAEFSRGGHLPRSDTLALTLGALAAATALAVHSMVDFNLHVPANALVLAFVFGLLAQPRAATPVETASAPTRCWNGLGQLALPAAAAGLAWITFHTLPSEYHAEHGRLALRAERHDASIVHARAGLARDARNPFLWRHLGQAQVALAETNPDPAASRAAWEASVESFAAALRLFPQEQWSLAGLGGALDALGRFEEADRVYQQAIEWNPTSATMRFHLATHLRLAGRFDEAEAAYRRSLQLFHNAGSVHGLELLAQARQAGSRP